MLGSSVHRGCANGRASHSSASERANPQPNISSKHARTREPTRTLRCSLRALLRITKHCALMAISVSISPVRSRRQSLPTDLRTIIPSGQTGHCIIISLCGRPYRKIQCLRLSIVKKKRACPSLSIYLIGHVFTEKRKKNLWVISQLEMLSAPHHINFSILHRENSPRRFARASQHLR